MKSKQSGVTLAIVLIFLLILTVLGVAGMSSSILQQRSANNIYLESEAFHVAESGVSAVIYADKLGLPDLYGTATGQTSALQSFCIGSTGIITPGTNCSGVDYEGFSNVNSRVETTFEGCKPCPTFELGADLAGIGCNVWKLTGEGTVATKTIAQVDSWVTKVGGCFTSDIVFPS